MPTTDYHRAYQREKRARQEAEIILENKTRELYLVNESLTNQYALLQKKTAELELFHTIAKFAQEEMSLQQVLQAFINAVCQLCGWPVGHVYMPDNTNANQLIPTDIWHLDNAAAYQNFYDVTMKTILTAAFGLAGLAYASGKAMWVKNLTDHPEFPRVPLCKNLDLKGGFTIPIKLYHKIVAITEFFTTEEQAHDQRLLDLVTAAASQLSILLERRQSEYAAKENYQKLLQAQIELKKLAHHDSLTNLPNRLHFENMLKRELARAERSNTELALLFIDLDYFKSVNDSYGHDIGDLLLKEFAFRLQGCVRAGDFVARLGGDEFAIILTHVKTKTTAQEIAEKLIEYLNIPYKLAQHDIRGSASIGIAHYPEAGTDFITLTKSADIAMYHAKTIGRNNYSIFNIHLNNLHSQRADIENALPFAIERNELSLVYQPKYNLLRQQIVGFEALTRWTHPTFGIIDPEVFIPIAEETGLIIKLGDWILQTACEQYASWVKKNNFSYILSVNVSPHQLKYQHFFETVRKILHDNALSAHLLELELTEMSSIINIEETKEILINLHDLGIKLSIDDFGTGYSTLSRLKQLPIDTIKIDKSFIKDVNNSANDALIVKAAITLAQGLGLNVIAEGVETEAQLNFLINNHCPEAQGYFYSKPLTQDEMLKLLEAE